MNPIGAEGNMFSALFDKVPAKRAGKAEDIAGTVLYLCSQAGVKDRIVFPSIPKLTLYDIQAYIDGRCMCIDGGRVLLANGQE